MDEQKKEQPTEFPFMIRAVNKIFKIASNRYISCSLSLILLSVAYLLDCYNKQPLFIEKFSAFVVIFGILLTIKKHRLDTHTFC
jgi:general stress protein CsbA